MGQCLLQRADGLTNQLRTVVERHDGHLRHGAVLQRFLGHAALHLGNLGLHVVDDLHGIRAIARHHDTADSLLSLLVQTTTAVAGTEVHLRDVLHPHGYPVARGHRCVFQVFQRLDISQSAYQVLSLVHLYGTCADIDVRILDSQHHLHDVHAIRPHGVRIQVNLVFLHVTAYRSHLRHTVGSRQAVAYVIVLYGAQLLRVPATRRLSRLRVASLQRVPEYLSQRRSIRT